VRRRVWRALEELPPTQRAAIVQRYYLSMSEAEMAQSAESSPGTIKRRLHDARKGLSKLLRPQARREDVLPVIPHGDSAPSSAREGGEDLG
jgi:DNA-directed RNA polymerase specialized sigma24 family protein